MMVSPISIPQCVLLTGANGFVGSHVIDALLQSGYSVKAVVRHSWNRAPQGVEVITSDLSLPVNWNEALIGVSTIIHLAARVHQMDESSQMAIDEFRNINTRATLELAEQAARAGVKRFIYLSTIAVNGSFTLPDEYFTEQSQPNSKSAYAISKYESELGLQKLSQRYSMEVTMIRPPAVYGLNAPGNFSRLVSLIKTRIPLPFGCANQPRSFIFIKNLVDFILLSIHHPGAGNELFLISDGDDIALNDLICQISHNLKFRNYIFPVPLNLLEGLLRILGRQGLVNQLLQPLRIDIGKARTLLRWSPPYTSSKGLNLSVEKLWN
ncbi:NAD-dependent epimerase/dehydratase family protein [Polynucleobacter paneuropaeus]|nr:NAD-dependent epimerase/dehydratase family protein [Polynucleobacter paneuropaeus]MBT8532386.1 NAD-dependent epimerase/dehydratase family protein [Polynucleobacter paneuropaeus]MBT8602600.1 NAD-dependent epimerase/dehydratase family protein [Polynucleobacter paneuropaeus]MBT8624783.1 NAD-dependent epimerase/dehydratase family protein [Polynucleobacter paneuropaeus]MBT8630106.1 NAD-dependent epimerase/dehydratase family protein [Polynucleobacter paneuropaeus]